VPTVLQASKELIKENWQQWGTRIQRNMKRDEQHLGSLCLPWTLLLQGSSWVWGSSLCRTRQNWLPREQREERDRNCLQRRCPTPWIDHWLEPSSTV
jgi:hypothetical protein